MDKLVFLISQLLTMYIECLDFFNISSELLTKKLSLVDNLYEKRLNILKKQIYEHNLYLEDCKKKYNFFTFFWIDCEIHSKLQVINYELKLCEAELLQEKLKIIQGN